MPTATIDSEPTLIDAFIAEQRDLTATSRFARWHEDAVAFTPTRQYRDLIPLSSPKAGEQYAFSVDLDKCSGCKACVCACHSLNGLDEGEMWRSVGLLVAGEVTLASKGTRDRASWGTCNTTALDSVATPYQQHVTSACHHCVEPACADGCPVLAYEKDPLTGIVRHLDDQCIGCQYCVLKCPYEVPKYSKAKGIVRKCDLCHHRLAVGEAPACVQACPHEAIRIDVVDQSAMRAAGSIPDARLVPGAFESNYTFPTTRYRSKMDLAKSIRPADDGELRLEPEHWPLTLMLILTQFAVGLHSVQSVLSVSGRSLGLPELSWAAMGILLLGLNVSVTHLGRPLKAWRAFLGWRRSWMSREIMVFSIYAVAAAVLLLSPGNSALALLTATAGLAAVVCSAMIYVDTRRAAWSSPTVFARFFGTTIQLGLAGGAVWAIWFAPQVIPKLMTLLLSIRIASFTLAAIQFQSARYNPQSALHQGVRIALRFRTPLLKLRVACFVAASVMAVIAIWAGDGSSSLAVAVVGVITLAEQMIERYLFFVTCAAPRMPGGAAA